MARTERKSRCSYVRCPGRTRRARIVGSATLGYGCVLHARCLLEQAAEGRQGR